MPYAQVPHAEKHGVRIGLDISAVVFVIHLTKIKVKKIHPWVLWLEAYIPIMGWLTYQYYMSGAYKNKNKTKPLANMYAFCKHVHAFVDRMLPNLKNA